MCTDSMVLLHISLTPSCGCELYTPLAVDHLGDSFVPVPPRSLSSRQNAVWKIHQTKPKVFGGCPGQQQWDKAKQGKMSPLSPCPGTGMGHSDIQLTLLSLL